MPAHAKSGRPPLWTAHDTRLSVELSSTLVASVLLSEEAFQRLVDWHLARKALGRSSALHGLADLLAGLWRGRYDASECERLARTTVLHRWLAQYHLMRQHVFPGWRPPIRLTGTEAVRAAQARGRGILFWVMPTAYSSLFTKMAFAVEGYAVSHLSRWSHGYSASRLGARIWNPVCCRIEDRYLDERVRMERGRPAAVALRRLLRKLDGGGMASITCGPEGAESERLPCLGGHVRIATGAPKLASRAGASLLPVFCARASDGRIEVRIEAPLASGRDGGRSGLVAGLGEMVRRIEGFLLRHPDQMALSAPRMFEAGDR